MDDRLLLGIDIGSSSLKSIIVDLAGNILAKASSSHSFSQPQANWAEQDPDRFWWPLCLSSVKECISKASINPSRIKGIAVTGMVPNLCTLDKEGKSVRPAILYRDNRTISECQYLNETFGLNFKLQDMLPKWYWIKNHEPENYEKISAVLNTHSYLIYKLTGKYNIDCDTATLFGEVFDLDSMNWKDELIRQIGLDPEAMPPVYRPVDAVGTVQQEICAMTGLPSDAQVFAGNGDSLLSMIGSGVVEAGDLMIYLGTAATMIGTTSDLEDIVAGPAFNSGHIQFIGNVLTGAEYMKWFKEKVLLSSPELTFEALEAMARKVPAGSDGLISIPHLEGQRTPVYNPLATGSLLGLTCKHTTAHIYRAILESIAYAMLDSALSKIALMKRFVISGGAGRSSLFRQIIADVFNVPVEYNPKGEAALGTAYFAGYCLGCFKDFKTLRHQWLKERDIIEPIPENVENYKRYFDAYQKAGQTLSALYPLLYGLKRGGA